MGAAPLPLRTLSIAPHEAHRWSFCNRRFKPPPTACLSMVGHTLATSTNCARASCFGIEAARKEGLGRQLIAKKSEPELGFPDEQSPSFLVQRQPAPVRQSNVGRARKNCWCFITRNPLKSHDSGERIQEIQENPTLINGSLCRKMATRQENPNRQDERPVIRPAKEPTGALPMQNALQ